MRPALGVRDFLDLLDALPERGAYGAARGPEGRVWGEQEELMATLVELVSVAASKDTRLRKPLDLPRPRYPDTTGPASDPQEVAAFFGVVYLQPHDDRED